MPLPAPLLFLLLFRVQALGPVKRFSVGRLLFYTFTGVVLLLCAAVWWAHLHQDKLLALFVKELNNHLRTKVELQKLELSLWEHFPQASITMVRPVVLESVAGSTFPMARAERLYFTFNLTDLWHRQYRIRELILESGTVTLSVDKQGHENYRFFQADTTGPGEAISFRLEKITLRNVAFRYTNAQTAQEYAGLAHELVAQLQLHDSTLQIGADGRLLVEVVRLGQERYFRQKDVQLHTSLAFDLRNEQLTIRPSTLRIGRARYEVAGTVQTQPETVLDLTAEGKNTVSSRCWRCCLRA